MARVLLIQPNENINSEEKQTVYTPLSLVYLGTAIEDKHPVKIYDRNLNNSDEDFLKFLNSYQPQIVGLTSGISTMLFDLIHLGKIIREASPQAIIIVGGVAATSEPEIFLKEPYIDYVLRGEGEEAFLEFCDTFDKTPKKLGKLKNINNNPLKPFVDVNKLKLPNYGLLDIDKYEEFYVNLTRGCPGNCFFCYNSRMWGKEGKPFIRSYSIEKSLELFEEIVKKYKRKIFVIVDDNFVSFKNRCIDVCNFLSKYKVHIYAQTRADNLDDEILVSLKKAGCHTLLIGVESGSQRVLDFLKKGTTVEKNEEAIQLCKKHKMVANASLMIGLPTETLDELKETVRFVKRTKPDIANVHVYKPVPAPLFDYCIANNLLTKPKTIEEWANMEDIFHLNDSIKGIPKEELKKVLDELKNFQLYRRKIKRFFFWMGQGEFKYMIKSTKSFLKDRIINFK
jgi:radical SAM superfamily enzyme YgiQ (UPF0313 family)